MIARKLLNTCDKAEACRISDSLEVSHRSINRSVSEYAPKREGCDMTVMKAAEKGPIMCTDSVKSVHMVQSHSMPLIADKTDVDCDDGDRETAESGLVREHQQIASEMNLPADHSVPVDMLPKVIKKLSEADSQDISQVHDADDDEVSDINRSLVSIPVEADSCDLSAKLNDPQLTAQSMQQFMKNVNRIRFNSMNTNNETVIKRTNKTCKYIRSTSCPDFRPKSDANVCSLVDEAEEEETPEMAHIASDGISSTGHENLPLPFPGSATVTRESMTVTRNTTVQHYGHASSNMQSVHQASSRLAQPSFVPPCLDLGQTDQAPNYVSLRHLPYEDLFPLALPFTPITQCQNCLDRSYAPPDLQNQSSPTLQPQMTTTSPPRVLGTEVPLFTALSPPELLDRQIQLGGEVHAKELSCIPLTSGESVSWTHFGGVPPSDEVSILRGQNMLLHTQMMYERHKREQHAIRNRRLLGKIVKNAALEEQNSAMRDQMQLQERNVEELELTLRFEQEKNGRLSEEKKVMELEKETELVKLRRSKEELEYKTKELQSMLVTEKDEKKNTLQELQSARSELFNLHEEMRIIECKVALTNDLQEQVKHLNKEVLLMGELQKKYREKMATLFKNDTLSFGQKQIIEAYKSEVDGLKSSLDQALTQSDALKTRITDMEEIIKNKEVVITDQKRAIEKIKNVNTAKFESMNDKYRSQQTIIQRLEAHILELHHQYSRSKRHSSPRSAQSSLDNNSRGTSPEQKTNGLSDRTLPIEVGLDTVFDQSEASHQELDSSNNAQVPSLTNDYLSSRLTTGKSAFQQYQPQEISSYPQYSKPLYSNFTSASEGQRYDLSEQPSFLMPYDSLIKPPDDLEASAADCDMNFVISTDHEDFMSASSSNVNTQDDRGASLNLDSGIVSSQM